MFITDFLVSLRFSMEKKALVISILALLLHASALSAACVRAGLVVFFPGPEIYELEGHAALHLTFDDGSPDVAINYGTFDFNKPNFVYRFVKGETDYWVEAAPWSFFERYYASQGRRIEEHPLMLDSLQLQRLANLIGENLQPQNREYRYNYVKDNCSTRPLKMVEAAAADSIVLPWPSAITKDAKTFREAMRLCHANYPWYQFGIDLALGSGIDYPISAYEHAFAPISLSSQLPGAVLASSGKNITAPVVVINEGHDATLPPTPRYLSPMAVACLLLAITLAYTVRDIRRFKITRWFDTALFSVFGLTGLLLSFLVFISVHEATSPNLLLLWLNPLCLIVPAFIWRKKGGKVVFSYQIINFALLMALCLAWPFFGQSGNAAFVPLIACDILRSFNYLYVTSRIRHRLA